MESVIFERKLGEILVSKAPQGVPGESRVSESEICSYQKIGRPAGAAVSTLEGAQPQPDRSCEPDLRRSKAERVVMSDVGEGLPVATVPQHPKAVRTKRLILYGKSFQKAQKALRYLEQRKADRKNKRRARWSPRPKMDLI